MANYVLLSSQQLTESAASVTFSNIPQSGYTDLKVVASVRVSLSSNLEGIRVRFNSDSGYNYADRGLYGNGASAASIYNAIGDDTSFTWVYVNADASTANTYGNLEMYVPNYTLSNKKSVSFDSVTENNATTAHAWLSAGLWNQTSAISSITFAARSGTILANSTFSLYGLAAVGTTPVVQAKATGGNTVVTDGTYWYHAFLSSGTFTPAASLSCDYFVVAGGAGGAIAGGGGAGGLRGATTQTLTASNYTVTVGAGGAALSANGYRGNIGSNSSISGSGITTLSTTGGGGGGAAESSGNNTGGSGGSGGGGGTNGISAGGSSEAGGSGNTGSYSPVEGYAGGSGSGGDQVMGGGGGGGASAAGGNGSVVSQTSGTGGTGGAGSSAYSSWGAATGTGQLVSSTRYFAGGGGGGRYKLSNGTGTQGLGGNGGGGNGGGGGTDGTNGTANTGGGGGGRGLSNAGGLQGSAWLSGGSGIVIIRYAV
jgi:hypothetical protein